MHQRPPLIPGCPFLLLYLEVEFWHQTWLACPQKFWVCFWFGLLRTPMEEHSLHIEHPTSTCALAHTNRYSSGSLIILQTMKATRKRTQRSAYPTELPHNESWRGVSWTSDMSKNRSSGQLPSKQRLCVCVCEDVWSVYVSLKKDSSEHT